MTIHHHRIAGFVGVGLGLALVVGALGAQAQTPDQQPTVSVFAPQTNPIEGRPLLFPVRLSAASEREVSVAYTTEAFGEIALGSAVGGEAEGVGIDYRSTSGTLVFPPNTTEQVVEVPTFRDAIDDPDETVILRLSSPTHAALGAATATGLIREESDEMAAQTLHESVLPYLATAIGTAVAGTVHGRINTAFDGGGGQGVSLQGASLGGFIAGQAGQQTAADCARGVQASLMAPPNRRQRDADCAASRHPLRRLGLGDLAFTLPLNQNQQAKSAAARPRISTLWGRGYYRSLSLVSNPVRFDGDLVGGVIGADTLFSRFLLGASVNYAESELDWSNGVFTGVHSTRLSGIHPYFGWLPGRGIRIWGNYGYETGTFKLTDPDNPAFLFERDAARQSVSLGGSGPLYSADLAKGTAKVSLVGDYLYSQFKETETDTVSVTSGWLRAGLEAEYKRPLSSGNAVGGSLELTWRRDYGDGRGGSGAELGGGLEFALPKMGLRLDLNARAMLTHSEEVDEWGVNGGIIYTRVHKSRRLNLSLRPEWGETASARERIWNGGFHAACCHGGAENGNGAPTAGPGASAAENRLRYALQLRYGFPVFNSEEPLTLFARSDLRRAGRNLGLGADIKVGGHVSAGYEAAMRSRADSDHRAYIRYQRGF